MRTMTKREEHANNLAAIADLSGDCYFRRMTYTEAAEWLLAYETMVDEGYPSNEASRRAFDCYFAGRQVFSNRY